MAGEEILPTITAIIVIVGLGIVFWRRVLPRFKGFPTTILTIEDRAGGSFYGMWDRGRRIISGKAGEEHNYELQKAKDKIRPATLATLVPTNKGDLIIYRSSTVGDFKPTKISEESIDPIKEDNRKWHAMVYRQVLERTLEKGFWDKYGTWVMLAILIMVVMGSNLMTINKMGELQASWGEKSQAIVGALDSVATKLGDIIKGIQTASGTVMQSSPPH